MADPQVENQQYLTLRRESELFNSLKDEEEWLTFGNKGFVPKEPIREGDIRVLVEGQEFVFIELKVSGVLVCADPRGTYSRVMVDWRKVSAVMMFRDI